MQNIPSPAATARPHSPTSTSTAAAFAFGAACPQPAALLTEEAHLVTWNRAFEEAFGKGAEDACFWLHALSLAERVVLRSSLKEVISGMQPTASSLVSVDDPTGRMRVLDVSLFPLLVDEVLLVGLLATDVTEQEAAHSEAIYAEAFYAAVLGAYPEPLVATDAEGRCLYVNPAAVTDPGQRLFGEPVHVYFRQLGLDDATARHWLEQVQAAAARDEQLLLEPPGGRAESRSESQRLSAHLALPFRLQPDGEVACVLLVPRPAEFSGRQPAGSEARLRTLLKHTSNTLAVVDAGGIVRYVSPAVRSMLGYAARTLVGKTLLALVHPDDRAESRVWMREVLAGEAVEPVEGRMRTATGGYIQTETTATNLLDDPVVRGVLLNMRDVTRRKAYETELIRSRDEAAAMAALKNSIVNNISHEIRTPLTAILGFAEVLREEVSPSNREFVRLIYQSAHRLMATLNSILDFSRLESGEADLRTEVCDLAALAQETAIVFRNQAEAKGLKLAVSAPLHDVPVLADALAAMRVLNNLVSNAVKFTDEGSVELCVRVTDREGCVDVVDTGMGIGAAFLPHLFEEFKQESDGLARNHHGAGLGLAISQRLVMTMGGDIEVETSKGAGSRFTVRLPLADRAGRTS